METVVTQEILEEYYQIKKQLAVLLYRESQLKEHIKQKMQQHGITTLSTDKIELLCKKQVREWYPKAKIQQFLSPEVQQLIKEYTETVVLVAKIRK
ncbi:MAG: hypothetical protein AABW49_00110 [Nanoarchaeota archaeon]